MEIDITIITVCFNSEKTIARTIESVLAQKFERLQYIIIDGCSSDSTLKIVDSYKDKFPKHVMEVYSEKDTGPYDAMNKGLGKAIGKIIGIINSDDWYEEGALFKVWDAYKYSNNSKVVIYGAARYIKDGKIERIELLGHDFLSERSMVHPACFVAKKVYDDIGFFDTQYKIGADWDFLLRAKEKNILFIPLYDEILSDFSLGGLSATDNMLEDLRLKYNHNLVSKSYFRWKSFKHFLKRSVYNVELRVGIIK